MTRGMSCDTTLYALLGVIAMFVIASPGLLNWWIKRQDVQCPNCHRSFTVKEAHGYH